MMLFSDSPIETLLFFFLLARILQQRVCGRSEDEHIYRPACVSYQQREQHSLCFGLC